MKLAARMAISRRLAPLVFLLAPVAVLASFAGCEAGSEAPATSGAGGASASSTTSTAVTTSSGGEGGDDLDGGHGDGSLDEDAACATSTVSTQLRQLDMVILLDRSGSMIQGNKWTAATAALQAFTADPASAGVGVGLQVFPNDADGLSCDYHDYEPPLVPIGVLPANQGALASAIVTESPGGNTPMYGALKGVLLYASAVQDASPDHAVIVVLASDGQPAGCTEEQDKIPAVATLIADAHAYNGVETYAIAIAGADLPSLDALASAGGTTAAYDVSADISLFAAKMAEIRGAALPCEVAIPAPPTGEQLDPELVNVVYEPQGQGPVTLPQAAGYADCGAEGGWYYDDPAQPTKIVLCPSSCTAVQADPEAELQVLFGCKTVPN